MSVIDELGTIAKEAIFKDENGDTVNIFIFMMTRQWQLDWRRQTVVRVLLLMKMIFQDTISSSTNIVDFVVEAD